MEAIVDQPFGDIVDRHPGLILQRAQIDDALMRHAAVGAAIEHRIMILQTGGDIVGAQYRDFGRLLQPSVRSEEHTSELQSLMRISYAVFCLNKTNTTHNKRT